MTVDGVDLESLQRYFADNVEGATDRPLTAELIAGGRSNLTYGITDGEHQWVLRRPPQGCVGSLPAANQAICPSSCLPFGCQAMISTRRPSPKRSV